MGILGKTMRYIMGYNWQYFQIIGYIKQNLRDILGKIMGYIWQNLGSTGPLDMLNKH